MNKTPLPSYSEWNNMSPSEKTKSYFFHNARPNEHNGIEGPTYIAQSQFINNWQIAFAQFSERLN